MEFTEFLKLAANVTPDENQLRLLTETPFYAFVHFSPNTYTDLEWGLGNEDEKIFNPVNLDCDQWCRSIVDAGMKGVVITAKHHDGFCLWQTKYTEHSIKNSPYKNGKGDIVAELADSCRKYGLKFGFYLSPWDRNSRYYGTDEYNTYYKNQLTELLTGYGEVFHVWFDGACGEGPNGKKQVYDFDGYFELVEKYQPKATIFAGGGNIRWCGNEGGKTPYSQWAVVPNELCSARHKIQTPPSPFAGGNSHMECWDINIGSIENIMYSTGLVFAPAEVDMSIRKGWFYHKNEEPHSLERLFDTYIRSVGGNSTFILNIPPAPDGRFDERDVLRLHELGEKIRNEFTIDLAADAVFTERSTPATYQREYVVTLPEKRKIHYIEIAENIATGQKIESFKVYKSEDYGYPSEIHLGTTVGNKCIIPVNIETDLIRVLVTSARAEVDLKHIKLY